MSLIIIILLDKSCLIFHEILLSNDQLTEELGQDHKLNNY